MWHVRAAEVDDLPRLVEIHARAYPVPRSREFRERRFTHNEMGPIANAFVVRTLPSQGDPIVAHGFVHASRVRVRDAWVPCGAIASIGVAPEARGLGAAAALIERLHEHSRARGDALTVLYPFREGFYERLGYGRVASYRRLSFSPQSVLGAKTPRAVAPSPANRRRIFRAARIGDIEAMDALYTQSLRTGTLARTRAMWESRLSEDEVYTVLDVDGSRVHGFVSYALDQSVPHAPTTARVTDFHFDDRTTRLRLLSHLAGLRDQVTRIDMDVAGDDPTDLLLRDADLGTNAGTPDVEHALGKAVAGPMVRMHDIDALAARRYAYDGVMGLSLEGEAPATLTVRNGAASLHEGEGTDVLSTDRATLGRIAFGGIAVDDAIATGLAVPSSDRAAELAASMFAISPYFSYDPF